MEQQIGAFRIPRLENLKDLVNEATACVTNDYKPQVPIKYPDPTRAISRFLFTLAIGGILLLIITIMAINEPNVKVSRVEYKSGEFHKMSRTMICPCLKQNSGSWNNFIKFFLIDHRGEKGSKVWKRTSVDFEMLNNICAEIQNKSKYAWHQCHDIVSTLFSMHDDRNHIQTTNLLSRTSLRQEAPLQITTKLLHTFQLYNLIPVKDDEAAYYKTSREIAVSFATMINQFTWKNSSVEMDYWTAWGKLSSGSEGSRYRFQMEINWTAYEVSCGPEFCDVVEHMSLKSKVFRAMVDVGGFSSVVLFVVKSFLWPLLQLIFPRDPHSDPPTTPDAPTSQPKETMPEVGG